MSFLYLTLNALLTCIAVTIEWSHFDKAERKPLCLTSPRGIQRSSYFLPLPYCWCILLNFFSGLLHWSILQAVYPVRANSISPDGTHDHAFDKTVIGSSMIGIFMTTIFGVAFLIYFVCAPFLHYKSDMPLAGTFSMAISAACHRPAEDTDAHLMPLKWGVSHSG